MKTTILLATALLGLVAFAATDRPDRSRAPETPAIPNPLIDYPGFLGIAQGVQPLRAARRLDQEQFRAMMLLPGTVVLDARSADRYALRHIEGAISLPFTDFTAEALARVIPDLGTRVLIYCNNNFEGDPEAFPSKRPAASLNISTYVALATYGYHNVYELGPLLDVATARLPFAGTAVTR